MSERWSDTTAAKSLASGLAITIFMAELLHEAALPEHSPHADPALPDPSRQSVVGGGSVEERPIRWLNDRGEPIQFVGADGHPSTFVANGRPSVLARLLLHAPGDPPR